MACEVLGGLSFHGYDPEAEREAKLRLDHIAKPLDGLGSFETAVCRIAGMQGSDAPDISKRIVVMMCADNGIVEAGVAQSSYDVTAKVAAAMSEGEASVCLMAEKAGIDTLPVDIGIKERDGLSETRELTSDGKGHYRLLSCNIAEGTDNFAEAPAMTEAEFLKAVRTGIELTEKLTQMGYKLICTGELGIGNTTTSAALSAAILHLTAEETAGRGAGLDDEGYKRKLGVIDSALKEHDLYRAAPEEAARIVGGLDIAALAGMFIGGAVYGVPVVIDGVISGTAALLAYKMCPEAVKYMLASHMGDERAMRYIMRELGLDPVIRAGMKLGEGTGAVMLVPLLDMAFSVYSYGKTFDDIKVGQYERTEH